MKLRRDRDIKADSAPIINAAETSSQQAMYDKSGWILDNTYAEFVLMHTFEIKFFCMLGYTYFHGSKLFGGPNGRTFINETSTAYKLVSMILKCTGGGILIPIFINSVPVPLAQDAYPIAILISFLIHMYFPVFRQVMDLSTIVKATMIVLYETLRASVVVKFILAANNSIPPSEFSFPLFGPIFCGAVAGCGGAFMPLNTGLDPIKTDGLGQPMISAIVAATVYHLFLNSSLSDGVVNAPKKAHVALATFFIGYGLYYNLLLPATKPVKMVAPPPTISTSAPATAAGAGSAPAVPAHKAPATVTVPAVAPPKPKGKKETKKSK